MALVQSAANSAGSERAPALIPGRRNVAILVYKNMEILDFAGPGEVFSVAGFNVYTVAVAPEPISSQGFVVITPNYTLANCPPPDIVVVPGGDTEPILADAALVKWVQTQAAHAEVLLSVCTGAGLLGKAGLLDGKQATTYHDYLDALQRANPKAKVLRGTRYVDNGQVITTAGISAGIDGSLHVVANLLGEEAARQVARTMEYDKWQPNQGLVVKAPTATAAPR
ncbi:DJ-1/PfpI family protein [Hymenobacter sp. RP-2-7]|uniref:DJ-1/PfpI family protein n=2 Tax=Hymenobacter polaris TaxID=2682546 RepID=A0A7Y0AD94_9BACT|nr:DJ-1/PfpI family protein [Hymenobacter polaris]